MGYYLMIKEAEGLNLKYLCKCKDYKDPYKYKGSGVYWRRVINKYQCNIITIVIGHYETAQELRTAGEYYSLLYNVVEDKTWANLLPEIGDGGPTTTGRIRIYNPLTKEERTIQPGTIPEGWVRGHCHGKSPSREQVEKTASFHRGRIRSEQTRENMRNSTRRKRRTVECEICNRQFTLQNIQRHKTKTHNCN